MGHMNTHFAKPMDNLEATLSEVALSVAEG